jgi:hypothetical protein
LRKYPKNQSKRNFLSLRLSLTPLHLNPYRTLHRTHSPLKPLPQIEVKDDEMVIAYVRGESIIGIFELAKEAPLSIDFNEPRFSYSKTTKTISRIF